MLARSAELGKSICVRGSENGVDGTRRERGIQVGARDALSVNRLKLELPTAACVETDDA